MTNEQEIVQRAMSILGSRTSERKAAASRRNGKLGGRPQESKKSTEESPVVRRFVADELVTSGLLDVLSGREKIIIFDRFGLDGSKPKTLDEIGKKLGLTRERIRQLQDIALSKLRRTPSPESTD
jgi:DNA-directed RNA polymerase sigma subunit (sigma70/sigma32)